MLILLCGAVLIFAVFICIYVGCANWKREKNKTELQKVYDLLCPVCGYYCLGKGGRGCIDKLGYIRVLEKGGSDGED